MRWSEIPFTPSPRTLRGFATLGALALGGLAYWRFLRADPILSASLAALAFAALTVGWLRPGALRPIFVGWMIVVFPLNWLVSHVLFALVYYCLFTPVGLVFRVTGRDLLMLRRPRGQASYWAEKTSALDTRSYFRQS